MLRIFCVYFDRRPLWQSDCVVPIQAGKARTEIDLGMLADDTGDQISAENVRYGEMTAWYWVWKNYLPKHPELTHVGFSHYRRFLDFSGFCNGRTRRTTYWRFRRIFDARYREAEILARIGDADLVMRDARPCGFASLRDEYLDSHPDNIADFDRFVRLLRERYPDRSREIDETLVSGRLAMELQFVMRREVFESFMEWTFSLCREFERRWEWSGPKDGAQARSPAFVVERLFLVWAAIYRAEHGLRTMELPLVKLTGRSWRYYLLKPFLPLLSEDAQARIHSRYK